MPVSSDGYRPSSEIYRHVDDVPEDRDNEIQAFAGDIAAGVWAEKAVADRYRDVREDLPIDWDQARAIQLLIAYSLAMSAADHDVAANEDHAERLKWVDIYRQLEAALDMIELPTALWTPETWDFKDYIPAGDGLRLSQLARPWDAFQIVPPYPHTGPRVRDHELAVMHTFYHLDDDRWRGVQWAMTTAASVNAGRDRGFSFYVTNWSAADTLETAKDPEEWALLARCIGFMDSKLPVERITARLHRATRRELQRLGDPPEHEASIITLRARETIRNREPLSDGEERSPVATHFRRGGIVRQAYGPRWSLRRFAPRRPTIVNPGGEPKRVRANVSR